MITKEDQLRNNRKRISKIQDKKTKARERSRTRKSLIKLADKYCSLYIRARDGKCVICGTIEKLTNGHLFSRSAHSTRWEEINCACQCSSCNLRHEYNPHIYTNWFIHTHGLDVYDKLLATHNTLRKVRDTELLEIITHYKSKLAGIQNGMESV